MIAAAATATTKNRMSLLTKSPSHYRCSKCNTKQADYYVLTGNLKAPSEMIPLCDTCYHNQSRQGKVEKKTIP